ncbi:MAG: sugar-binding protein [Candidatus Vecturithrix sp.]|jgi:ribose transport system substrate-binding protein|nr:sugar-binding protein [Candidatus Vecturithrix sp.]
MMKSVKFLLVLSFIMILCVSSALAANKTFVMVPKAVHPYYEPCYEGFKAAAEKYGVEVEFEAPQEQQLGMQVKVIEDLIARGVDGIALSALDDAGLVAVVDEAMEAGVKVLTFDAEAPSTSALSYIGTNNGTAGYEAGKQMIELMGGSGQVALLQATLGAVNLNVRAQEFKRALEELAPDIKMVAIEEFEGDYAKAVNKVEALLETYPDLKAIFGISAYGAPAAATVVKEQEKVGQVIVAGFDDLKDTLDGIRDGSIAFCLVQKTFKMGWLSVEKLLDAVEGKEIPKNIDTGILIVDSTNVDTYMEDMKKEFIQ